MNQQRVYRKETTFILAQIWFLLLLSFLLISWIIPGHSNAASRRVKVKLATFIPKGTFWVEDLERMGSEWRKITDKKVTLKIYAGGIAGDDIEMLKKLKTGQLHAATLSTMGITNLVPDMLIFETPGLFQSQDEVKYILEKLDQEWRKRFAAKGYTVLHWGTGGWNYVFTTTLLTSPKNLKQQTVLAGTNSISGIYRKVGFTVIEGMLTDILLLLANGKLNGVISAPLFSLAYQWFPLAPNMLNIPWSPALGATVIKTSVMEKIDKKYHEEMLEVSNTIGREALEEASAKMEEALVEMRKHKLNIYELDEEGTKKWREHLQTVYPYIQEQIGNNIFEKTLTILKEYRSKKKK